MSEIILTLAQFIYILWPLFIVTALVYSFQGRQSLNTLARRIWRNLTITWVALFLVWMVTWLAPTPNLSLVPEPWNTVAFTVGFAALLISQAARLGLFRRRLFGQVHLRRTRGLQDLKNMDPYAFENLVAETYRGLGYQAKHVGHSGDHGVDIQLRPPNGELWIVQCKRYHGTVGESIVRDLYGTMVSEKARRAILVTTAEPTPPAIAWAQGKPIELVDGPALLRMIDEARQRTQGSLLARLSRWFEGLLLPVANPPPGLREPSAAVASGDTVPTRTAPRVAASAAAPAPRAAPQSPAETAAHLPGQTVWDGSPASIAYTQPVRPHPNGHHPAARAVPSIRYLHGRPICPRCGLPMVPRPPQPNDRPGRTLYRCRNYPACRVVLEAPKNVQTLS